MGKADQGRVEVLGPDDLDSVVSVFSESFFDYPVMRFVLGAQGDYADRLRRIVTFFVMARVLRDEVVFGIRQPGGLAAAALVSYPDGEPGAPALSAVREETWGELGAEARARYEAYGAATVPFAVDAAHIHLNMVGVRTSAQGRGLGRALMEAVHALSASRPASTGVTLSTEVASNVTLYEHLGYEVIGSTSVVSAFTTWAMYRR